MESNVYRPDAGLYHLPYIGILNTEKIIIGLSNLHSRYGLISITQYLSAISNNYLFGNNGIVYAQALIANAVILNFSYQIYKYNNNNKYEFHFFFLLFCFVYFFYKMNRYSEYGNDAPAHFLLFFLISELILNAKKFNLNNFLNQLILSLFIIQIKLTLIFLVFFHLINIKNINIYSLVRNYKFIFLIIFFLMWISKNILVTGCMLYPIKVTCFDKLNWVKTSKVEIISNSAEAWTKGWSDQTGKILEDKEFLKNFNWIQSWSTKQLKHILNILMPYIIFISILTFFIAFNQNKKKIILNNYINFYFLIIICSCIFWFIKSPLYRYGYSFIISLFSFILSYYLTSFKISKNINKIISFILILGFTIIGLKNSIRIYSNKDAYNNYPWPKYYSMNELNREGTYKKHYLNTFKILTPNDEYCMYSKGVCSHYGITDGIQIRKKMGYLIIYENKI